MKSTTTLAMPTRSVEEHVASLTVKMLRARLALPRDDRVVWLAHAADHSRTGGQPQDQLPSGGVGSPASVWSAPHPKTTQIA